MKFSEATADRIIEIFTPDWLDRKPRLIKKFGNGVFVYNYKNEYSSGLYCYPDLLQKHFPSTIADSLTDLLSEDSDLITVLLMFEDRQVTVQI